MKPRIAIISNYPSDHKSFSGGVETATAGLLEGLQGYQNEFEFHIVSFCRSIKKNIREQYKGFQFHFLKIPRTPFLRPRYPFNVFNAYFKIRQIKPDLIHCQDNMMFAIAAIFHKFPKLFTVHGVNRHEAFERTGWEFWSCLFNAVIEYYVHRNFNNFICISEYSSKILGDKKAKFSIPNPVRNLFFQDNLSAESKKKHLLFIGVVAPLKRPADLLAAHAGLQKMFPDLKTIFCGDVEDKDYFTIMKKDVLTKKIKGVRFSERIDQQKLANLLKDTIALVLPSVQENSPMVVAEAMASGVPVIASRVGGVPEMIRNDETGLLFDVGDINALTDHLKNILDDTFLRDQIGKNARIFAETNYSPESVAKQTVNVYRHLLNMA